MKNEEIIISKNLAKKAPRNKIGGGAECDIYPK